MEELPVGLLENEGEDDLSYSETSSTDFGEVGVEVGEFSYAKWSTEVGKFLDCEGPKKKEDVCMFRVGLNIPVLDMSYLYAQEELLEKGELEPIGNLLSTSNPCCRVRCNSHDEAEEHHNPDDSEEENRLGDTEAEEDNEEGDEAEDEEGDEAEDEEGDEAQLDDEEEDDSVFEEEVEDNNSKEKGHLVPQAESRPKAQKVDIRMVESPRAADVVVPPPFIPVSQKKLLIPDKPPDDNSCPNCGLIGHHIDRTGCPNRCFQCWKHTHPTKIKGKPFEPDHQKRCKPRHVGSMRLVFDREHCSKPIEFSNPPDFVNSTFGFWFYSILGNRLEQLRDKPPQDLDIRIGSMTVSSHHRIGCPEEFRNYSAVHSQILTNLMDKILRVQESFVFDVGIVNVQPYSPDNQPQRLQNLELIKLSFALDLKEAKNRMFYDYLETNSDHGFMVYVNLQNKEKSDVQDQSDDDWKGNYPRPVVPIRRSALRVYYENYGKNIELICEPCPLLDTKQPGDTVTFSINYETEIRNNFRGEIFNAMESDVLSYPVVMDYLMRAYINNPLIKFLNNERRRRPSDLLPQDLPFFNTHAFKGKLLDSQVKAAQLCYDAESALVMGPASSGKTLIGAFIGFFNWLFLRRRTLFVTKTPRQASRLIWVIKEVWKEMAQSMRDYGIFQTEPPLEFDCHLGDLFSPLVASTVDYMVQGNQIKRDTVLLVTTMANLMKETVHRFPADHVVMLEVNLLLHDELVVFCLRRNHELYSNASSFNTKAKHYSFFADPYQGQTPLLLPQFLNDEVANNCGFSMDPATIMARNMDDKIELTEVFTNHQLHFWIPELYGIPVNLRTKDNVTLTLTNHGTAGAGSLLSELVNLPFFSLAVTYPETNGPPRTEGETRKIKRSVYSVDLVISLLKGLVGQRLSDGSKIEANDIAVISQFRAQQMLYKKELKKHVNTAGIESVLVESCRGGKWKIVIIDPVARKGDGHWNGVKRGWPCYNDLSLITTVVTRATKINIIVLAADPKNLDPECAVQAYVNEHVNSTAPYIKHIHFDPALPVRQYSTQSAPDIHGQSEDHRVSQPKPVPRFRFMSSRGAFKSMADDSDDDDTAPSTSAFNTSRPTHAASTSSQASNTGQSVGLPVIPQNFKSFFSSAGRR